MKKLTNKQGFTLIEVVLVLAIGGLIFLLAFIAFQQVSTNRRDTQRRADAGRVVAELQNYFSDNRKYPAVPTVSFASNNTSISGSGEMGTFIESYMGGAKFKSPDDKFYTIAKDGGDYAIGLAFGAKGALIQYGLDQKCNGSSFTGANGVVAIKISLEKGEVCRDSIGS